MNRYKWYRLGLPISLEQLLKELGKKKFGGSSSSGFVELENDGGKAGFRFAWRTYIAKTSFDNEGVPKVELIESTSFCDFHLFKNESTYWLRVLDPPRSLKELLNALEEVSGFGFFSDAVLFRTLLPRVLAKGKETKLIGFKAMCSLPEQHAVARVEVASKDGLLIENLQFLKQMKYSIDHSVYEITYRRIRGQVSFSSTGVLKISGQLAPLVLQIIEADIIAGKN